MEFNRNIQLQSEPDNKVSYQMKQVLYALIPATFFMIFFFGWGAIFNLTLAIIFAVSLEALMLKFRKRPIKVFLGDYSALVTAWLLALALPAFSAWWVIFVAIFFAIIVAKHLFGGLGYNPFNPAMVGYAVVLISFPVEMTRWFEATFFSLGKISFTESWQFIFGYVADTSTWDSVTMATPLDKIKTGLTIQPSITDIIRIGEMYLLFTSGWLLLNLLYLIGGFWLVYKKIITWHIPLALLGSLFIISNTFWLIDSDIYTSPLFHLFSGATMLGAFFIATDPVSASTTPLGKLLYAAGIGFTIYIIRTWGNYPDAIAFSVIIMNMAVPLIDYYTQPKVFGK